MADYSLEFTGERMVPEQADSFTFWEHIYRYQFALGRVRGKRVLDIASGEGYGAAAMALYGAQSVIGVDISADACRHAIVKYGVDARVGSGESIPLPDKSVDVVVSFETIEHIPAPRAFLAECYRVLDNRGLLIVSTPNRDIYTSEASPNPYHCSEMDLREFSALIQESFHIQSILGQCPVREAVSDWSPLALTQVSTIWWKIPGFSRVLWKTRSTLIAGEKTDPSPSLRGQATDLIGRKESWFRTLFNPWIVRKLAPQDLDRCRYIVAVAVKR